MAPAQGKRVERLQVMLSPEELQVIDHWRYHNRIPSRAAAVRELLRRGLLSNETGEPVRNAGTEEYTVIPDTQTTPPSEE